MVDPKKEPKAEEPEVPEEVVPADVDHVAMVSYDADGKPAQTPGYQVIK
jgi:hypothetical protein